MCIITSSRLFTSQKIASTVEPNSQRRSPQYSVRLGRLLQPMHKNLDDLAARASSKDFTSIPRVGSRVFFLELANHSSNRNLWVLALGILATQRWA